MKKYIKDEETYAETGYNCDVCGGKLYKTPSGYYTCWKVHAPLMTREQAIVSTVKWNQKVLEKEAECTS